MITEIGKVKIKWHIKPGFAKAEDRLLKHYKIFLASQCKNVDIKIAVIKKKLELPQNINPLLQTRSWQYFKHNGKLFFNFYSGNLAEIDSNFKNIKFYTQDENGQLLLYLFPEVLYSFILPKFGGILLHACGVKMGKKIFVFLAPPEGGKSTISKLALRKGLTLLNDDRIILRKLRNKFFAFGNPWHGEVGNTSPDSGEIKELFFLKKAKRNYIQKITRKDMFLNIIRNSFYLKEDKGNLKKVVEIVSDIADNIEGYILGFKPDESIWEYLDGTFRRR